PSGWLGGWTLFYRGWWVAWSPFVGMFIARISRGRTVREFVVGVLLVPLGFTFLWMTVYGNSALYQVMGELARAVTWRLVAAVRAAPWVAVCHFLAAYPRAPATAAVGTLLVGVFFVTPVVSGALVVDMLWSRDHGQ